MDLFFQLIQVALRTRDKLTRVPNENEWLQFLYEAKRQAVMGIVVDGIDRLPQEQRPNQMMLLKWIGLAEMVRQQNVVLYKRSVEIQNTFAEAGFRSCILKGQGNARIYPNPFARMPGDIDIWVDGERNSINDFVAGFSNKVRKGYKDVAFQYKEVEVEAHYFPAYLNSFSKNKKWVRFIEENKERQFTNWIDVEGGNKLCVPTDDFNIIYQMCHLYHHFFCEGVGLRHFIDYFYLLKRINGTGDCYARYKEQFQQLGMLRFVSGVMWIENKILGLANESLLVDVDEKTGQLILKEILEYGNFNNMDMKGKPVMTSKLSNTFRPFKYLFQFPKESIDRIMFLGWLQLWKLRTHLGSQRDRN